MSLESLASLSGRATPGPGQQAITYHGLTVDVPRSWKLNDYACGPRSDTVLLPGPRDACGPPPQTVTTVEFVGWPNPGVLTDGLTTTPGILDGTAVTLSSGRVDNGDRPRLWERAVEVPAQRALVVVRSPDRSLAERIAGSARLVATDSSGCPVVDGATRALPGQSTEQAPPGARSAVLPGDPATVRVCRYNYGLLEHGILLRPSTTTAPDDGSIQAFQEILGRAPHGTYRVPPANYLADICRDPKTPVGEHDEWWDDGEGYRIVATYDDGSTISAVARINLCGDLGVSNGWFTVQPTTELAAWMVRLGLGGFVGPLPGDR